jgi:hypothetical protein
MKRPFEVAGTLFWNAQGRPTQDDFSSICAKVISCMTNTRFCRVFITRRFLGLDHPSSVGRRSLANVEDNGQLCAQEKKTRTSDQGKLTKEILDQVLGSQYHLLRVLRVQIPFSKHELIGGCLAVDEMSSELRQGELRIGCRRSNNTGCASSAGFCEVNGRAVEVRQSFVPDRFAEDVGGAEVCVLAAGCRSCVSNLVQPKCLTMIGWDTHLKLPSCSRML